MTHLAAMWLVPRLAGLGSNNENAHPILEERRGDR